MQSSFNVKWLFSMLVNDGILKIIIKKIIELNDRITRFSSCFNSSMSGENNWKWNDSSMLSGVVEGIGKEDFREFKPHARVGGRNAGIKEGGSKSLHPRRAFHPFHSSRREPTESPIFVGSNLKGEREKPETKHLQPIKEKLLECACFVLFYREKRLIDIRISRLTSYTM